MLNASSLEAAPSPKMKWSECFHAHCSGLACFRPGVCSSLLWAFQDDHVVLGRYCNLFVSGLGFCCEDFFPKYLKQHDTFLAGHEGGSFFGMNPNVCTVCLAFEGASLSGIARTIQDRACWTWPDLWHSAHWGGFLQ